MEKYQTHQRKNESGMPLGGIGAGKIEFCRNGRFTNITINNNWDCPIYDGRAGTPPMPRIKEGFCGSVFENALRRASIYSAEGLPGAWLACYNPVDGANVLKAKSRPAFKMISQEQIGFSGRFPIAHVNYPFLKAIQLDLDAFSSFVIPDFSENYHDSSLPIGLFVLQAKNITTQKLPISLAMSWQNINGIGGYAGHPINQPDPTPPLYRNLDGQAGLWFDHDTSSKEDLRVLGNYTLLAWADHPSAQISWNTGWDANGSGEDIWHNFAQLGSLSNVTGRATAGALAVQRELNPGEQMTVVFSLAWYMPHLLAAETDWTHLVRPSSAPPPPISSGRTDYGHVYNHWFNNSWQAAEYGLHNWKAILNRVRDWQKAFTDSNLPEFFIDTLCNDLFPLYTNAWYTKDLLFAMNESPTDMNGCMGTLDQRGVGNGAIAAFFPKLNRAELELFARDQIGDQRDQRHFGRHFNTKTARYDLIINRQGAILHDVGWDHLEGGRTGDAVWLSAHWPELTSLFILHCYQYAIWSGDKDWLDQRYPQIKLALQFQARLDQDEDGIADLWGAGSCTYDTELYPYFGASSYVASLYLAALEVAIKLAEERDNHEFVTWAKNQLNQTQKTMETDLWDEELGYYISWYDRNHHAWDGLLSEHALSCRDSQISQLAGMMWAELFDLGHLINEKRRNRAIGSIANRNVKGVPGCPADEYRLDDSYSQSMLSYVLGYYANMAITVGQADAGWEAVRKIYRVRYELDGSPWDAILQCSGDGNEYAQWGRWYLSTPASWYVLWALSGVRLDRINHTLWLAPSWPSEWGENLRALPVYLPDFQARVDAYYAKDVYNVQFSLCVLNNGPFQLQSIGVRLPASLLENISQCEVILPKNCIMREDGLIIYRQSLVWTKPGDGYTFLACLSHSPHGKPKLEVNISLI